MKMTSYGGLTQSGRPYYVFDNVHNQNVINNMFLEIDLCIKPMMQREKTGGTDLKNTNAVFLTDVFANPYASNVFKACEKFATEEVMGEMAKFHWAFDAIINKPLSQGTQVLYYEDSDSYGKHPDLTVITILYWLAREPQGFTGGDIRLDDDVVVEFKHNRAVAMSIGLPHEVIPVKSITQEEGYGRYCISNFYNYAMPWEKHANT